MSDINQTNNDVTEHKLYNEREKNACCLYKPIEQSLKNLHNNLNKINSTEKPFIMFSMICNNIFDNVIIIIAIINY